MKSKYYLFGIQLGVPPTKIKEFEKNCQSDIARCFCDVLSYWIDGNLINTPVEWETIFEALKSKLVDERGLANKLRQKYGTTHGQGNQLHLNLQLS